MRDYPTEFVEANYKEIRNLMHKGYSMLEAEEKLYREQHNGLTPDEEWDILLEEAEESYLSDLEDYIWFRE